MGTTYQVPNLASYEHHHGRHSAAYGPTVAHNDRARPALVETPSYDSATRYSASQEQARQAHHYPHHLQEPLPQVHPRAVLPSTASQAPASRPSTRPATPSSVASLTATSETQIAVRDASMVLHSLQIPTCLSPNGGDFADFTAQITCLFWFESIKTLEAAEKIRTFPSNVPVRRLTENALPLAGFKKWVHTVLSTTQVTQNVVLLALMFIYRLKVKNPAVKGRAGSEYRLLTVALMLGNKFLDDNTYTNKTWAEVSGISVTEIHVMEVEFLSNMRYGLLASKEEWEEWLSKLASFWEYCERAQRPPASPLVIPSPSHRYNLSSPLPSPTGIQQLAPSAQQTTQQAHTYSPTSNMMYGIGNPTWHPSYQPGNAASPLALKPALQNFRKRSLAEDDPTEPPAKRTNRQQPQSQLPSQSQMPMHEIGYASSDDYGRRPLHISTATSDLPRLPIPSLTLNTGAQNIQAATTQAAAGQYVSHQASSALSLPPLVPGMRAMSTVFAPTTTIFAPQLPTLASSGPHIPPISGSSMTPTTSYPPSNYGTPTKRLSPHNSFNHGAASYASSPLTDSFPHHSMTPMGTVTSTSGVHTPISNSPSVYLQQRPSPYKPVRHVNTLLYPPPSAFLHEYHISNAVTPGQMHYQPLGRRNEFRTGIVPEFAMARSNYYGPGQHQGVTTAAVLPMQHMAHGQVALPTQSLRGN